MLLPAQGGATIRELRMAQAGLDPAMLASTPSVRLFGLGGLDLSVPDEANELNVYDFGANVSGLLQDADSWVIQSWLGNHRHALEQGNSSFERSCRHSGIQSVYRGGSAAYGMDINWSYFEGPDSEGNSNRVSGPLVSVLANQVIGPVTLGLRIGSEAENEDHEADDFFGVHHQQSRTVGQIGAHAGLLGLTFGAAWDFARGEVRGKSEDPSRFHSDDLTWTRPVDRYSFFCLLAGGGALEGGVRTSFLDREGSERIAVSWSDDSPQNPSQTDYFGEAVTFWEDERDLEIETRWRVRPNRRMVLGFSGAYRDEERMVIEAVNFKGSLRAGTSAVTSISTGAGLSVRLMDGRLLGIVEGRGEMRDWTSGEAGEFREGTARSLLGGVGLEYFLGPTVLVRGGLSLGSRDQDVDEPLTLAMTQAFSGGLSWLGRGGLIQVHAGIRYERFDRKDSQALAVADGNAISYALGLRLLP